MRRFVAPLFAFVLASCESASAPSDDLPESSFAFQASGAVSGEHSGRGITLPLVPGGYVSHNPQTGERRQFDVTPIVLADLRSAPVRQLFIGLLGQPREGTYSVFNGGQQAQFYADFRVPQPNEIDRSFTVTGGSVTITKVTARGIAGHFTLQSNVYFDWPRNSQPGVSATGMPTTQSLTGTFVAGRSSAPAF